MILMDWDGLGCSGSRVVAIDLPLFVTQGLTKLTPVLLGTGLTVLDELIGVISPIVVSVRSSLYSLRHASITTWAS